MNLHLSELDPSFVRYLEEDGHIYYKHEPKLEDAQGVEFLCPKCFITNNGPIGTHSVICWFRDRGVPDGAEPGPGRWHVESGTGWHDLTLAPSIQLHGGCAWHGWVKNGHATE